MKNFITVLVLLFIYSQTFFCQTSNLSANSYNFETKLESNAASIEVATLCHIHSDSGRK
jgi:hypothetical protein